MINRQKLIDYLGGTHESAAKKLGYAHRNAITRLPKEIPDKMAKVLIMRMRAYHIKVIDLT